jgi:hypothetical protein
VPDGVRGPERFRLAHDGQVEPERGAVAGQALELPGEVSGDEMDAAEPGGGELVQE